MKTWSKTTFQGKIHIKHGFAFKGEYFVEEGKYLVLTPGNFNESGGFRIREGKEKYYRGEFPIGYIHNKGDLIVAMTEQGEGLLGSAALIPESDAFLHNQRIGLITLIDPEINKTFLYYIFNSSVVRQQIRNSSSGTKVRHTSPERMYQVKINLPGLKIQKKIASILSAYDDLIENNKRRIAILENMAEEIYKEWFVRFRFPGYEDAEFVKGIPKGWEVISIGDSVIQILDGDRGKAYPKKEEFNHEGYCLFLNTGNIKAGRFDYSQCDFINESKDNQLKKGRLKSKDIVLTTRGTVGNIAYLGINSPYAKIRINSGMVIIRSEEEQSKTMFFYHLLKSKSMSENYKMFSSGSAQPQLPIRDLKKIKFLYPETKLIDKFESVVKPLIDNSDLLCVKNLKLEKIKNSLLPRLISGKLSVEGLEIK